MGYLRRWITRKRTDRSVTVEVSKLQVIKPIDQEEKKLSNRIEKILKDKVKEHNDSDPKYRVTIGMLRKVLKEE